MEGFEGPGLDLLTTTFVEATDGHHDRVAVHVEPCADREQDLHALLLPAVVVARGMLNILPCVLRRAAPALQQG
jgi:hypothetical protein